MKKVYSDVIQYRGSHYDFGVRQGELLKGSLLLKNREKYHKKRNRRYKVPEHEAKKAIQSIAPHLWEELIGLKDSLGWTLEETLNAYGGYLLDVMRSGCSVFTNEDYMVRNYDFHPSTYEGRLVMFQPTNNNYATIGPTQHITGRMDGMNEKGLIIAYNFVNRKNPGIGFIPNMISRIVLETCANVHEAVRFLKEIPHFHSFNYVVHDSSGQTYVVEATPRNVKIHESMICTNHFEVLADENRYHLVDSKRRMKQIAEGQKNINHPYDAFRMFNDKNQGIFSEKYKSSAGTIHTAMYFSKEKQVLFSLGGDRKPIMIDFQKWLSGEDFYAKKIIGYIQTDLPFAHMN